MYIVITEGSPAAVDVPPVELKKRAESHTLRKKQLSSRPDLFISRTRLSVRNLPLDMDDKGLRRLAISAINRFKQECKENKRTPLTAQEREEGWSRMPRIVQVNRH
jgi:nucleolar protein 4